MAISVTNGTIDSELVYENRGGVETYYVPDTQGSLIECHDATGAITYEAWYWPYGEIRSVSGSKANSWGYIGLLGYLADTSQSLYVRARYNRPDLTRWQTVDPLWPTVHAYVYVKCKPTVWIDPTGLIPLELAVAILGCLINASLSSWDVLRSGGGLGQAFCKGALSCLTGAIVGFILTLLPEGAWVLGCIIGAVGSIIGALLGKLCEPAPRCIKRYEGPCIKIAAGISGFLGCFGGDLGNDLADFLIGFIASVFGLTCHNVLDAITPG